MILVTRYSILEAGQIVEDLIPISLLEKGARVGDTRCSIFDKQYAIWDRRCSALKMKDEILIIIFLNLFFSFFMFFFAALWLRSTAPLQETNIEI
jgi:hypothetical protein